MKREFDIEEEWMSYEIHPETPPEGTDLANRFSPDMVESMGQRLQQMGEPYGVKFGTMKLLPNSRKALEASEFAKDKGKFHEFHRRLFKAYFTDGQNIGDGDVLRQIATACGLDASELQQALNEGRYEERLYEAQQAGKAYEVTGTPTFIINDRYKLVGAQPISVFRQAFSQLES